MRHLPPSFLPVFPVVPLLLSLSIACTQKTGTTDHSDHPGEWAASVAVSRDTRATATGETAHVLLSMKLHGPKECTDSSSCNGPTCTEPTMTPGVEVVAIDCPDGVTCTTGAQPGDGSVRIDVTSNAPGVVFGTAILKSSEGQVTTTTFDVRFARPTGIAVARPYPRSPGGVRTSVLPGTTIVRCPDLASDAGPLAYTRGDLTVRVRGSATDTMPANDTSGCTRFTATTAGEIAITYAYKTLDRIERIQVVDPSELVAMDVVELPSEEARSVKVLPIEDDRLADAEDLARVDVTDCTGSAPRRIFAARMHTRDGRIAFGMPEDLHGEPAMLAQVNEASSIYVLPRRTFFTVSGIARGDGELVATLASGRVAVPLRVASACHAAADAGTSEAGADAGADDDAGEDAGAGP